MPLRAEALRAAQHREALRDGVVHALQSEQRHARGGHLERERQTVQPGAEGAQRRHRIGRKAIARVGRAHAVHEHRERAGAQRLVVGDVEPGYRQRLDAFDAFACDRQRQLTRHQKAQLRRGIEQHLREAGDRLHEMLGVVHHEQARRGAQCAREDRHGLPRRLGRFDAECAAQRGPQLLLAGQHGKVEPDGFGARVRVAPAQRKRPRERRLADAAWSDEREAAGPLQTGVEPGEFLVAAEEMQRLGRCGERRHRERGGPFGRQARAEPVAAPRHGDDQRAAERLAQGVDLHGDVGFLHDEAGPDGIEDLVLGDEAAGRLREQYQQVERACAERHRRAVAQQASLGDLQLEAVELQHRQVHGFQVSGPPDMRPSSGLCSLGHERRPSSFIEL